MKRLNNRGFTLIELLAVIVVLALLVIISSRALSKTMSNAKAKAMQIEFKKIIAKTREDAAVISTYGYNPNDYDWSYADNKSIGSNGKLLLSGSDSDYEYVIEIDTTDLSISNCRITSDNKGYSTNAVEEGRIDVSNDELVFIGEPISISNDSTFDEKIISSKYTNLDYLSMDNNKEIMLDSNDANKYNLLNIKFEIKIGLTDDVCSHVNSGSMNLRVFGGWNDGDHRIDLSLKCDSNKKYLFLSYPNSSDESKPYYYINNNNTCGPASSYYYDYGNNTYVIKLEGSGTSKSLNITNGSTINTTCNLNLKNDYLSRKNDSNIYLFTNGRNETNKDSRRFKGRIYYFKMYDSNNLVYDLIPVSYSKDGQTVKGMYNLVDDVVYDLE